MAEIEKKHLSAETSQGEIGQIDSQEIDLGIHNDIALGLYQQSLQYDPVQLEKDAVKVRRKLDFIVLPMMMTTYMLSFLDKQTLNYSNAYGLQEDTHMTGNDYSWVASALYFGWLVGAYPANVALQRFPVAKMVGCIMFLWAALCMCQAAVFNFSGFFAVRFFLGFVEAVISPAWVLLTSSMWTREEQSFRTNLWIGTNGVSSILGSLLSWGLGHANGTSLANWKLIYLVCGAMTFLWAIVILLFLPDGPHNGKMFSEYERVVAVWRISRNKTGVQHPKFLSYQVTEALIDPKTYMLLLMGFSYGILNGSVANFMSSLIKGFGFSALKSSLLQMPGGACELIGCIVMGYMSTFKNMTAITMSVGCLLGLAGIIGLLTIDLHHRWGLVVCAWIQNFLGSPLVMSWTLPALNTAGHTKRATVAGLFFVFFAAGNITGPHFFFATEAPRYHSALVGLLVCWVACLVLHAIYFGTCLVLNRTRDRAGYQPQNDDGVLQGFEDMTDSENKHFRYHI